MQECDVEGGGLRHAPSALVLLMSSKPSLQEDEMPRLPGTSPIEKLYRYMWRRKVGCFTPCIVGPFWHF